MANDDVMAFLLVLAQGAAGFLACRNRSVLKVYQEAHPFSEFSRPELPEEKIFSENYTDANAREDFRFTVDELKVLAAALRIPDPFQSSMRDRYST